MERVALTVEKREIGKGPSRRLRATGRVPGVLYGRAIDPIPVLVGELELEKIVRGKSGMNVMVDLTVADGDSGLALIRDYQADPFKRRFVHVDFQAISENDKIEVEVPLIIEGDSIGVKEGGVIELRRRTLHIAALPNKIPDGITVNISALDIGDSIHADEINLPEGVEFPHAANYAVVSVVPPTKIVETVVAPVEGAEGAVPVEGAKPGEAATSTEGEKTTEKK
jgi:large subunit ribosomal protein L25